MNHSNMSWDQAANRLAAGIYERVTFSDGTRYVWTFENHSFVRTQIITQEKLRAIPHVLNARFEGYCKEVPGCLSK